MSGYRLETFLPATGPGFRREGIERRLEAAREKAYTDGYLDGQAAATDGFLEEQGRLTTELVEAIEDARLSNEAARRHVAAEVVHNPQRNVVDVKVEAFASFALKADAPGFNARVA